MTVQFPEGPVAICRRQERDAQRRRRRCLRELERDAARARPPRATSRSSGTPTPTAPTSLERSAEPGARRARAAGARCGAARRASTSRRAASAARRRSRRARPKPDKQRNRRASFRVELSDDQARTEQPPVIQKKICLLGGVRRRQDEPGLALRPQHVLRQVPDDHRREDREEERRARRASSVELVIWDIYGEDDFQKVRMSYLRGASGYLLVVDGTRRGDARHRRLSLHAKRAADHRPRCRSCSPSTRPISPARGRSITERARPARLARRQDERQDRRARRGGVRDAGAGDGPSRHGSR